MSWNYRLVKKYCKKSGEAYIEMHEVYYNSNGEIDGITENAISPFSETSDGIKLVLEMMLKACDKEVLIEDEIVYAECDQ